jgi:hypothetical protein
MEPVEGGCRCGRVRLRISAPPLLTVACHCTGCQRMSSSAYTLTAVIPSEGFAVTQGEPVIGGLHGPGAHHHFCPHCMTWLFTRAEGVDWFVNLRPTMLDEPRWNAPFAEMFTREKLPWVTTPAVHSFHEFPTFEDFKRLMGAYAAHIASGDGEAS